MAGVESLDPQTLDPQSLDPQTLEFPDSRPPDSRPPDSRPPDQMHTIPDPKSVAGVESLDSQTLDFSL